VLAVERSLAQAMPEGREAERAGVLGVVLCGGRSRRMGRDKALVELGGRRLIEYPLEVLAGVAGAALLACGPEPRYAELGLECALDEPGLGHGPLAGLLAGLEAARRRGCEWIALLACDMPRADRGLLCAMLRRARERELDACLLESESGLEPLFGVYRTTCAAPVRAALRAGQRRVVAFHPFGVEGRALRVESCLPAELVASAPADPARNLNRPEDLEREARSAGEDRA
jgi:molybdopterin-guanine dinucleotide biosynthesis protein A